jgi:hypothetical protein
VSTTSTYPTFKASLFSALADEFLANDPSVTVGYAWTPDIGDRAVFFGRFNFSADPDNVGPSTFVDQEVPTIKAGRKQRQETYPLEVTVSAFRPDLDSSAAAEAEADVWAMLAHVENVLAADPQAADTTVQYATVDRIEVVGGGPIPFERGWVCVLVVSVDVNARLT